MIKNCFRCGKEIDTPDAHNADYIMATDTIAKELRVKTIEVPKTQDELRAEESALRSRLQELVTKTKLYEDKNIAPDIPIEDIYGEIEGIAAELAAGLEPSRTKVVGKRLVDIQKANIVCPSCYLLTDVVIWGVHKK